MGVLGRCLQIPRQNFNPTRFKPKNSDFRPEMNKIDF